MLKLLTPVMEFAPHDDGIRENLGQAIAALAQRNELLVVADVDEFIWEYYERRNQVQEFTTKLSWILRLLSSSFHRRAADIVPLLAINGGHSVNATVKVRWNKKIYTAKIVHISTKDQWEKEIGDVTGDGKLVEIFFTVGESSFNPQDGIDTGTESNNGATDTMEQIKAGVFELVEQMTQMKDSWQAASTISEKRLMK
ncbi:unnamed protein product [Haemonchus placei]|uniref:Aha1_N domain-containing protein n=1 Tax=Haemonchus placei TaxID=6290 RepID=A0A158QMT8_HAEPC|nr:unnamed protein product [Haemonchus placei]